MGDEQYGMRAFFPYLEEQLAGRAELRERERNLEEELKGALEGIEAAAHTLERLPTSVNESIHR